MKAKPLISVLVFSILCIPLLANGDPVGNKPAGTPNILCILVDDLGFGDLSCQGASDLRTPNIDQLAEQGMRMTQFYANCTVCSPSRASLLTGRYPDLVGVPGVIRQNAENNCVTSTNMTGTKVPNCQPVKNDGALLGIDLGL